MICGIERVRVHRLANKDAFFFNWSVEIPFEFQQPFAPIHENMAGLHLRRDVPVHQLAAELRRAFSGIVAGNVKEEGMRDIAEYGPFRIEGDPEIMRALDRLLRAFVAQGRMKMSGEYRPCYEVVAG